MTHIPHGGGPNTRRAWPALPGQLVDTTLCPSCFTPLAGAVCFVCGLDLNVPRAGEVLEAGRRMLEWENARQALLDLMRAEQHERTAVAHQAPPARDAPAPQHTPPAQHAPAVHPVVSSVPAHASAFATEPTPTAESAEVPGPWHPPVPSRSAARRYSSVQVALLVVGVSLVSVAAIFFVTVAWVVTGLGVRSLIAGGATVAALTVAAILRRRRLTATAEGIGTLGVVLVLVDLWAVRGNDLFGSAAMDAPMYWGIGMLACAGAFLVLHVVSGLRIGSIAGFALAPVAVGMLAAGLAEPLDLGARITVGALAAAGASAAWTATLPSPSIRWRARDHGVERIVLYIVLFAALGVASLSAIAASPDSDWAPVGWFGAIAVVAASHCRLALHRGRAIVVASALGSIGVVALSLIAPLVAARSGSTTGLVTLPALVAVILALAFEWASRGSRDRARPAARATMITARLVAACLLVPTTLWSAWPAGQSLWRGVTAGHPARLELPAASGWALATLVACAVLIAAFWAAARVVRARVRLLAWVAGALLMLAVPFLSGLASVVCGYVILAAASTVTAIAASQRRRLLAFRPQLIALLSASQCVAFVTGWASSGTWWIGTVGAVGILYLARYLPHGAARGFTRPILTSAATVLALVVAGVAPWALTLGSAPGAQTTLVNVIGGLTLGTAVLLTILAVPWRRFLLPAERTAALLALAPFTMLFLYPIGSAVAALPASELPDVLQPEPWASAARAALLLLAVALWLLIPGNRGFRGVRRAAAGLLAPVLALVAVDAAVAADADAHAVVAAAAGAGLVCAGIALTIGLASASAHRLPPGLPTGPPSRWGTPEQGSTVAQEPRSTWLGIRGPLETGAAVVGLTALAWASVSVADIAWFVVLIIGVGLLLAAISAEGLFAALSWRQRLGWAALAFGVAALWMRLSASHVEVPEAYVLPVVAALLLLAGLLHRYGRDRSAHAEPAPASGPAALSGRDRRSGSAALSGRAPDRHADPGGPAVLVFAGLLLAAVPLSFAGSTGTLLRPVVVGAAGAALLLIVALRLRRGADSRLAIAVGVPSAVAVLLVAVGRAVGIAGRYPSIPFTFDVWLGCASAVLCLAGVLVALRWQSALDEDAETGLARPCSTVLTGIGLAVGLLPGAAVAATGSPIRAVLVLGFASAVAIGCASVVARQRWRTIAWMGTVVGAVALCMSASGRLLGLLGDDGPADGRLEGWLVPSAAALVAVAVVLSVPVQPSTSAAGRALISPSPIAQVVGPVLVIAAMAFVLIVELPALDYAPLSVSRILLLTWGFSAMHAVAFMFRRLPLTPLVGWLAIAAAGVAAVAGVDRLDPVPFESATLPIGGALLVSGALRLMRDPLTRSWPRLWAGLGALLFPSLLIGFWDAPLWRIVALGLVATATLVIGLVLRLQAPFLLGGIVVLIHAGVQLWPWIAAAYQSTPWWLWIGAGGLILIALAARYERRVRDVKAAVLRISALR